MNDELDLPAELERTRQRFLGLVAEIRPDLHRYCARMTGSVVDGEDIVQDTLARAYFALPELDAFPQLRPWLFAIAHRRAIDHLRRYEQRMREPLDAEAELATGSEPADDAIARVEAVRAALSRFIGLPPVQRSAVVLKDVLGHSLEEIGALLELSIPAVKAALHRGRQQLRNTPEPSFEEDTPPSPALVRYVELFNARNWDGVRAMLADDVRLDVVSRVQRRGSAVGSYFERYAILPDWHLVPAFLEGREVLAVLPRAGDCAPSYFIALALSHGLVHTIRDFRHVPYITRDARIRLAHPMLRA